MKFLLTRELGRLAKWMRILGFDTEYFDQGNLSSLLVEALRDDRVIISRNHRLPQSTGIRIALIKSEKLKEQLEEVFRLIDTPVDSSRMFSRCVICNKELVKIEKTQLREKIPEYVFNTQEEFTTCPKCNRIYWPGTHWGNVKKALQEIEKKE